MKKNLLKCSISHQTIILIAKVSAVRAAQGFCEPFHVLECIFGFGYESFIAVHKVLSFLARNKTVLQKSHLMGQRGGLAPPDTCGKHYTHYKLNQTRSSETQTNIPWKLC